MRQSLLKNCNVKNEIQLDTSGLWPKSRYLRESSFSNFNFIGKAGKAKVLSRSECLFYVNTFDMFSYTSVTLLGISLHSQFFAVARLLTKLPSFCLPRVAHIDAGHCSHLRVAGMEQPSRSYCARAD
jgi:hypothetical protein